jgi:mRNA interferase RelE/StbE
MKFAAMYEIWLTRDAQKFYQDAVDQKAEPLLRPTAAQSLWHPNIKRLKGPLAGHWPYRVGDWRVVYRVDEDKQVVTVVLVVHRSRAYR